MNLIQEKWTEESGKEFQKYLISLGRPEKVEWTKRIINTEMPVLAVLSPDIKKTATAIMKGDYFGFLDLSLWEYYENTSINGTLISHIKDFDTYKKYLLPYAEKADNWATCDVLTFNVTVKNEEKFFALANELRASDKPFVRRIGIDILFKFVNERYIDKIFDILDTFTEENEYYVNMVNAWLLAECFIKQRDKTLAYFERANLNKFTVNKAVQKCRDSFRISKEDKDYLLKFKK